MTQHHTSTGYRIEHGDKPADSRLVALCSCGAQLESEYRYNDLQFRIVDELMREHQEAQS